jgi:hypothetical protein
MNRVDLHIHSDGSHDGEFSARDIVHMGAELGMKALSITDHNTVKCVKDAVEAGEETGVEVLAGIEIECAFEGLVLHVLGYMIDFESPEYAALEATIVKRERTVGVKRVERLREMGIPIEVEDVAAVAKNGMFTGPIIASALFSKPEARAHPLLARYFNGESRNPLSDFYWDFVAYGKPAYVPNEYYSLKEIVGIIHHTGGVSVLAHPGAVIGGCPEALEGIAAEGVDGVEVYCSYHSREEAAFYLRRTRELGLIPTLGSDFHGYVKPSIRLGGCGYEDGDGLDLLYALKAAKG